jgi:hypothetical protein
MVTGRHESPDRLHSVSHIVPAIPPCLEQAHPHGKRPLVTLHISVTLKRQRPWSEAPRVTIVSSAH